MPTAIKLIVGLGNPEPGQLLTRHNAGFWFVDALVNRYALTIKSESRFHAEVARLSVADHDCLICKPQTYMNNSGRSVQAISSYYRIPVPEILVVHDEIDLEAGVVRFKQGGGHGGNNGLRDIIEKLGDNNFNRLRIGIGHPGNADLVTGYVLNKPSREDADLIMSRIGESIDLLPLMLDGDFNRVMTGLHTKVPGPVTDQDAGEDHDDIE